MRRLRVLAPLALCAALIAGATTATAATASERALSAEDELGATFVGAGDIAGAWPTDDLTALLLDSIPGQVYTVGDNVYLNGWAEEYQAFYGPSWGRHKWRTRPAVGNHDYASSIGGVWGAEYHDYFGAAAGPRGLGYYSYDVGAWHVVVLNGECAKVGGCGPDSPQADWLRADLATHPTFCTAAIFHYPRFNSGEKGNFTVGQTLWEILHMYGAEVVLSGDNHVYERFAPQTPTGTYFKHGIRQFIVGTGGGPPGRLGVPKANSERFIAGEFGVLKFELGRKSYTWEFVPALDAANTDSGADRCHGPQA